MSNFDEIQKGFIMEWVGKSSELTHKGEVVEVYHKTDREIYLAHKRRGEVITLKLPKEYVNSFDILLLRSLSVSMFPPFGLKIPK